MLCLAAIGLRAAEPVTRISVSEQFVATGVPFDAPSPVSLPRSASYMQIEPDTAIVSCERIKAALLHELQLTDRWQGKVYVRLHVRRGDDEPVAVQGQEYPSGWVYSIDLPDLMDRRRFFNTIVQVLLLEIANRGTRNEGIPVDMPKWLEAGMPAHLEAQGSLSLLAEPFKGGTENQRPDRAVETLRQTLRETPPLALEELSWPDASGDPGFLNRYRSSSHLLVRELLRMDHGARDMAVMLASLHNTLNWQTSFLQAYASRFQRMVDVDKWWGLTTALFLGRERSGELAFEEVVDQLGQILSVPLDITVDGESIQDAGRSSIQRAIERWDSTRVEALLNRKIARLQGLQWRSPPRIAPLVAGYRETLATYLAQRNATGGTSVEKVQLLPNAKVALKKCVRQLDELDHSFSRYQAELAAITQSRKKGPAETPSGRRKQGRRAAVDPEHPSP
ncbi:MAG: hypothetical protein HYR88_05315 [Verrucomicrobia bacterium]|nr:hypothetical protein [Verrucomicrobiota bacterium]MBI3870796.1 hypothetical protein [Verrucomicrobiota bacterium]